MATTFEELPTLSPEEQGEAKRKFKKVLDDSDMVFVAKEDGSAWVAKCMGVLVTVTPDYAHNVYLASAPLHMTLAPGREVAMRALVNHLEGFELKAGEFWAQDAQGDRSWKAGSDLYFGVERPLDGTAPKGEVKRVVYTVVEEGKVMRSVNDGTDPREAVSESLDVHDLLRALRSGSGS